MSRTIGVALAGAALAASFAPAAASADPWPPPPVRVGECTFHWYPIHVFSDDVPITLYFPRCVW